jgi:hypothetical protein
MLTYKHWYNEPVPVSFKCRMCKVVLSNPDELRMHSMVKHRGHMI